MTRIRWTFLIYGLFSLSALYAFDSIDLTQTISFSTPGNKFVPGALALGPDQMLWAVDSASDRICKLSAEGAVLQAVGGSGRALGQLKSPQSFVIDAQKQIYVADTGNHRIQIFNEKGERLKTIGEKGNAFGQFNTPVSIALTADELLVVSDAGNQRIQIFTKQGIFLSAIAMPQPIGHLTVDAAGRIYIVNQKLRQVDVWSSAGQLLKSFNGVEPGMKGFQKPDRLGVSATGQLLITDQDTLSFRDISYAGRSQGVFGKKGAKPGEFLSLDGFARDEQQLYFSDAKNKRIQIFKLTTLAEQAPLVPGLMSRIQVTRELEWAYDVDALHLGADGKLATLSTSRGEITLINREGKAEELLPLKAKFKIQEPTSLVRMSNGQFYVSDVSGHRLVIANPKGDFQGEIGKANSLFKSGDGELSKPMHIAVGPQGNVLVADAGNARIQAFNAQGLFLFSAGEKGSDPGQLKTPTSVAWDKERLYVADPGNKRVAVFNSNGRYIRELGLLGPEPFEKPKHVALDAEGNLYVLDVERCRVLIFDPQGVPLGGFGTAGTALGFLNEPRAMVIGSDGRLLIAEAGRIQVFQVRLRPLAPANVQATSGEGYVELKWDPISSRFPAKYSVYRSTQIGSWALLKESMITSFIDDTLLPQTTYYYAVSAQSVNNAASIFSAIVPARAEPSKSGPLVELTHVSLQDVFSAQYKYYGRTPLGTVRIKNNSPAPIQKIKLTFAIQGYMDYPTEAEIVDLGSLAEKEVPLQATFNNRILEVTETTPVQAQIKMSYYRSGEEKIFERTAPLKLHSRNTIRWDDKNRFSSFVTPNDPSILNFSRGIVIPWMEAHPKAPLPETVLKAWAYFTGLSAYGITYLPRPNNPYDRSSLDTSTVDTVQFARETLSRKSGDCADMVALYASGLESLSIATVAIDVPGHLFLMFDTGISQKEELGFPGSHLVSYAGTYWIPIETTLLGSDFMQAWKQGADTYRKWEAKGKVKLLDIHQDWKNFEPATLPELATGITPPKREILEGRGQADWKNVIQFRWETKRDFYQAQHHKTPANVEPLLRLGFDAIEFGKYEEAHQFFEQSKKDASLVASALNGQANVAYLKADYAKAALLYEEAIGKDAIDGSLYLNLARAQQKLGQTKKAEASFTKAGSLDPSLRESFPDLQSLVP